MRHVRSNFSLALTLLAAIALPSTAAAQQSVELTSVGDGVARYGVYVGHYTLAMPGTPSLDVYCVDFLNGVSVGNTWTANVSNLSGSLADTRHGDAALTQYQRAAWLTTQFALNSHSEWGAIHAAIWVNMLPPSYPDNGSPTPGKLREYNWANWGGSIEGSYDTSVAYWVAQADANYASVNLADYAIITDVSSAGSVNGGRQEYITTVTPEPGTMILLGTGLIGLFGVAHLRRRRQDELLGGFDQEVA